jgi:hypothetical protein
MNASSRRPSAASASAVSASNFSYAEETDPSPCRREGGGGGVEAAVVEEEWVVVVVVAVAARHLQWRHLRPHEVDKPRRPHRYCRHVELRRQ